MGFETQGRCSKCGSIQKNSMEYEVPVCLNGHTMLDPQHKRIVIQDRIVVRKKTRCDSDIPGYDSVNRGISIKQRVANIPISILDLSRLLGYTRHVFYKVVKGTAREEIILKFEQKLDQLEKMKSEKIASAKKTGKKHRSKSSAKVGC